MTPLPSQWSRRISEFIFPPPTLHCLLVPSSSIHNQLQSQGLSPFYKDLSSHAGKQQNTVAKVLSSGCRMARFGFKVTKHLMTGETSVKWFHLSVPWFPRVYNGHCDSSHLSGHKRLKPAWRFEQGPCTRKCRWCSFCCC